MTPLTENPKIKLLILPNGKIGAIATNIAAEVEVDITNSLPQFAENAEGMPFVCRHPENIGASQVG